MNISFIGIIICFIGSFLGALGDKFVHDSYSKSENEDENGNINENYKISKKNLWLLGILLSVVIDPSLTMIALYFTSAALVTPFAGVHILWNLIITNICLKIRTKLHQYMGSFFLICGIVLIITFSEKKVDINNMNDLINMYSQTKVIIYLICVFSVIVILLILCLIPLCFHDMDNVRYIEKIKFLYSRKLTISPSKKLHNSFIQKIKGDAQSTEKKVLYKSKNYNKNSVHYSNSYKNTNYNGNLTDYDDTNINNKEKSIIAKKDNSFIFLKSENNGNLDNEFDEQITENLCVLPDNSVVVINKQDVYVNLMNNYYSKKSITEISKKKLFSSNYKELKKWDSTKLTKKKNICKKNLKVCKLKNAFNKKKKYNETDEKYKFSLINKKKSKLKSRRSRRNRNRNRSRFCLCLSNKISKNTIKENSIMECSSSSQNESVIDNNKDEDKYDTNNNNSFIDSELKNLNFNENMQKELPTSNKKKKKESFYFLGGNDSKDSKIIEIYEENNIIMLQYKSNSQNIDGYHENNKEKEIKNKNKKYNSLNVIPLKSFVKKNSTSVINKANEDDNDNNDDNNINISTTSITNNSNKGDSNNNMNANQFQYMSFITAIYLIPSKSKKVYTETIYYSIYCSMLCGMSGGLVNILIEQIIGVFSQEKFHMFEYFFSYFLISLALFCLLNQLIFLNVALSHFSVTAVIPLIMSSVVFFSSLTTIIMQLKGCKIEVINAVSFSFGVLLVIVGILYLQYNINYIVIKYLKKKK